MKIRTLKSLLLIVMVIPLMSSETEMTYYERLVQKYGSLEAVRENYLPPKDELKQYLKEFYRDKNDDAIEIKSSSKLHTHRNKYNAAPRTLSKAKSSNLWEEASFDYGYHGGKPEFRGTGLYAGCQAVYEEEPNGMLDDYTSHMGTFDYAYFYSGGVTMWYYDSHKKWDIRPHDKNNNYATGLTKKY